MNEIKIMNFEQNSKTPNDQSIKDDTKININNEINKYVLYQ